MDIEFTIDGTRYSIPLSAYYDNVEHIKLPDGRIYIIDGWLESYPPQVQLTESAAMIVRPNAVLATKVT